MNNILQIITFFFLLSLYSCGKSYKETKIGKQIWMVENLNIDKFQNGDIIPQAKSKEEWEKAALNQKPVWCYYDYDLSNKDTYGKLYNWYAIVDSRNLAPKGWEIPSYHNWSQLIEYLGGENIAGSKMKSRNVWIENSKALDESKFSAYPSGVCNHDGTFDLINNLGFWWSSTEFNHENAWVIYLSSKSNNATMHYYPKSLGLSVRCIKN